MRISKKNIVWDSDPASPWQQGENTGRFQYRKKVGISPMIVRPNPEREGTFVLVVGVEMLLTATDSVDCRLENEFTEEEVERLRLVECYERSVFQGGKEQELGKLFLAYRKTYNVTQQELARRAGITPGTIHHYESLDTSLTPELKEQLRQGNLSFKEARSFADFTDKNGNPDCARQLELAEPFVSGQMSSVHVERLTKLAKRYPEHGLEVLLSMLKVRALPAPPPEQEQKPVAPADLTPPELPKMILDLAGALDMLANNGSIEEVLRLKLLPPLRILKPRFEAALQLCEGGMQKANPAKHLVRI